MSLLIQLPQRKLKTGFPRRRGCVFTASGSLIARLPCAAVTQADFKSEGRPVLVDFYVVEII